MNPRKALTIAGSDSGGGAGIQADLKTFSALGVYGASVITAITAQNTVGVTAIMDVTTDVISRQIEAVLTDIKPQAVKTGMLSTADIIQTVSDSLSKYGVKKLVVDPVMVAKSGDRLLQDNAISALIERLLPQATVLTPNIPEAEVLTGKKITTISDMEIAADTLRAMGPKYIIVKGGHLKGEAIDVFYDGRKIYHLRHQR
ncbi:MAG TPA: bifunctional hydroxymethylpyrimidine kinase/phosphomethylpyrimidine kinase, partial [bacterium]|nr:bifunctional hydroxymethylpyrimidine kinase/phosphomethylpyrimidine kinase [bacterium]